jgi:hypothetical protein
MMFSQKGLTSLHGDGCGSSCVPTLCNVREKGVRVPAMHHPAGD